MNVKWMRQDRSKEAHWVNALELSLGRETVTAIGECGPFQIAEIVEDELASRCAACMRGCAVGAAMSLHVTLFGLSCVFCGHPVRRLRVYADAIVTQHEPCVAPDCVHLLSESPAGGVVDVVPRAPASAVGSSLRAA